MRLVYHPDAEAELREAARFDEALREARHSPRRGQNKPWGTTGHPNNLFQSPEGATQAAVLSGLVSPLQGE